MPELWDALGYDSLAEQIALALQQSADLTIIEGPPGVGKSWLAKGIGGTWQKSAGSTVVAEGDVQWSEVALYPFTFAMSRLGSKWKDIATATASSAAGVLKAGETFVGTAGIITSTVQAIAAVQQAQRRNRTPFLGDVEQQILFDLERHARKQPVLLIADNLHWWDVASLDFLGRLRSATMRSAFPFLEEVRVLIVQTIAPYQSVSNPKAHNALLSSGPLHRFTLSRIPREGFERVLLALGASTAPSTEIVNTIYAFSGGHLTLVKRCADRIAAGDTHTFLSATDQDEFAHNLLTARMQGLGDVGKQAVRLLQIAAVWGLTFRRDELTCISGVEDQDTSQMLRYCRDEQVIDLSDNRGTFAHDFYRQYFLGISSQDKVAIYERMLDCLRQLHPAAYDVRCLNALNAEHPTEAATLGVQAALQCLREGRSWSELPATVLNAVEEAGLMPLIKRFATIIEHLNAYRFRECLNALDQLPRDMPKRLTAEADYLRAMCLMSTRSEEDRAAGRSIVEAWSGYEEEEFELGMRLMQLLLYGLFHLGDKEPGLKLEARMKQVLSERAAFDVAAKDACYVLDRCSGGLYPVDMSVVRNREAVTYFGPSDDQSLLRRPVEYYRCLVNLGASLISNARYGDACEVHRDLEQLVGNYSEGVFPRLDFPRMNRILAEYRNGDIDACEAAQRQGELASSQTVENDPFYFANALAVYLALAEDIDGSLALFDELDVKLAGSRTRPEPSMTYLIRSNRCMTRYLAGRTDDVSTQWASLAEIVAKIAYPSRGVYVRRHELLSEILVGHAAVSPAAFDGILLDAYPAEFGPLWKDYGRSFMLPAIELWREN
jgi:hypothetical protein